MDKIKRKLLKSFLKDINKFNKGKTPKLLRVFRFYEKGRRIEIINNIELSFVDT